MNHLRNATKKVFAVAGYYQHHLHCSADTWAEQMECAGFEQCKEYDPAATDDYWKFCKYCMAYNTDPKNPISDWCLRSDIFTLLEEGK